ncbi:hypothetical protein, partial [Bradyrhizobium japonicum]|uniref:hypothetical protein n=1 Tax=Bradyrhizobium japonicum TaxID=375 RepID=UPI000480108B
MIAPGLLQQMALAWEGDLGCDDSARSDWSEPRYFLQKWVESITRIGGWTMKKSRFTEEQIIGIL